MNTRRRKWLTFLEGRSKKYHRKDLRERVGDVLTGPVPLEALKEVGDALRDVPHAIIGGHAVTIQGQPRMTSDVDVLVQPAYLNLAVERLGGRVVGPLNIGGKIVNAGRVEVDLVSPDADWVSAAVAHAETTKYGQIASRPYLVVSKMWDSRGEQDDTDVVGIIRKMNEEEVAETQKVVKRYLPGDVDDLDQLIQIARGTE